MNEDYCSIINNLKGIKISLFILIQVLFIHGTLAQEINLNSPDEQLEVTFAFNDKTSWDAVILVRRNASRNSQDYKIITKSIHQIAKLDLKLSSGGVTLPYSKKLGHEKN